MQKYYNKIIIFQENKEKKLYKRINKLKENKKSLDDEICKIKLEF